MASRVGTGHTPWQSQRDFHSYHERPDVNQSAQRAQDSERTSGSESLGHLLAVWFLVGSSFWRLGFSLVDATTTPLPLSRMGTGLLFGTLVVVALWVGGVRPSIGASAGYFLVETAGYTLLVLVVGPLFVPRVASWPLVEVAAGGLSITLAATLVFTDVGTTTRARTRQWLLARLKVPSADDGPSSRR